MNPLRGHRKGHLSDSFQYWKILLQIAFSNTEKAQERTLWFTHTLLAILIPITCARTSNLLRCLQSLLNLSISKRRFYTFMASPKLPWENVWKIIWQMIPQPFTEGRLITALDDSINCKTGKKIFGCQHFFDHAAKANQSRYPWSKNIVTLGLLKQVHGRWCCLPLGFAFYFMKKTLMQMTVKMGSKPVEFKTKFEQAVDLLTCVSRVFVDSPILVVTDSWFGNAGLLKPLRLTIGKRVQILSRLRVNAVLYAPLTPCLGKKGPGRPRKYGERLGSAANLAAAFQSQAKRYTLPLYGKVREVMAYDQGVLLKTLRCQVRVVWVFRKTQWIALVTTDLDLSVPQIIEYYAARWKIEAGFKEIKQEIGSAHSQSRNPFAVTNHLQFCMLATTLVWVYAERLENTPKRRYVTQNRTEYAFADVRQIIADEIGRPGFVILCHKSLKSTKNTFLQSFMRLVA